MRSGQEQRTSTEEWRGAVSGIERNPGDCGVSHDKKLFHEGDVVPLCQTLLNNQEEAGTWLVDLPGRIEATGYQENGQFCGLVKKAWLG